MRSRPISVCTRDESTARRRVACCRKQTMSNYAPARRAVYGEVDVYAGISISVYLYLMDTLACICHMA